MRVLLSSCQGLANFYAPGEYSTKFLQEGSAPRSDTLPYLDRKGTPLVRPTKRARGWGGCTYVLSLTFKFGRFAVLKSSFMWMLQGQYPCQNVTNSVGPLLYTFY